MLVYCGIIAVLYLFSFTKMYYRRLAYWLCVVVLVIVSGIRYDVGIDWNMYVEEYAKVYEGQAVRGFEPGYELLEQIFCRMNFSTAYMLLFCVAAFTIVAFARVIEKNVEEKYWFFSLSLFVTTAIYFQSMNQLRQFLATAILLPALVKLQEEKYWQYLLYIGIAFLFHEMILIALILPVFIYICRRFKWNVDRILLIIFLFSLTGLMIDYTSVVMNLLKMILPSTNRLSRTYLETSSSLYRDFVASRNSYAILKVIFPNVMWIAFFLRRDKVKLPRIQKDIYFSAFTIFIVFCNLFYGVNVFMRLSHAYEFYLLFLYPALIESFSDVKKKFYGKLCILGYYLVLTVYTVFFYGAEGVVPYQTIFS